MVVTRLDDVNSACPWHRLSGCPATCPNHPGWAQAGRDAPDADLSYLRDMIKILELMTDGERRRCLAYLCERYVSEGVGQAWVDGWFTR